MVSHYCLHHLKKGVHLKCESYCAKVHISGQMQTSVMNLCSSTRNWAQPHFEITQAFTSSAKRIYFTWSQMFQYSLQAKIHELRFHFSSWWKGYFCKGTLSCSSSYGEHCMRQKLQGIFLKFPISNIEAPELKHFCLNISLYWGKALIESVLYKLGNISQEDKTFNI